MTQIEYVDDEQPPTVKQIRDLLTENEDGVVAVAVCAPSGLNLLTNAEATPAEIEKARMQLSGLLEHFDELVAVAKANSAGAGDADA